MCEVVWLQSKTYNSVCAFWPSIWACIWIILLGPQSLNTSCLVSPAQQKSLSGTSAQRLWKMLNHLFEVSVGFPKVLFTTIVWPLCLIRPSRTSPEYYKSRMVQQNFGECLLPWTNCKTDVLDASGSQGVLADKASRQTHHPTPLQCQSSRCSLCC